VLFVVCILSTRFVRSFRLTYQRRDKRSYDGTDPGAHGRRPYADVAHHRRKQFAAKQVDGWESYRRSDYAQRRQHELEVFDFRVCTIYILRIKYINMLLRTQ